MQQEGCERKEGFRCPQFLVNTRDLQLECARVLHETLIVPVLMQMDNFR